MQNFAFRQLRIIVLGIVGLIFSATSIWMMLAPKSELGLRTMGLLGALLFGFGFIAFLRILLSGKPGLVVDEQGFQLPLTIKGAIPWTQVVEVTRRQFRRSDFLTLKLDPNFAKTLVCLGPAAWFARKRKAVGISLTNLEGTPDDIKNSVVNAWQARLQNAKNLGEAIIEIPPEPAVARIVGGKPMAIYGLIALFVVVYICEIKFAVDNNNNNVIEPSARTLAYLGGDLGNRVKDAHEYWRMFTAPLMHTGLLHIFMNSLAFWWAGSMVERIAGWKWMLGIFTLTALAGEAASLMFLAPNIVGVGASGGVMGVLAAVAVMAGRMPLSASTAIRTNAMQWLIPSILPILLTTKGNVNYYAHLGGAVIGLALGYGLLKFWKRDNPNPPLVNLMAALALCYFGIAAYALIPVTHLLSLR